MKEIVSKLTWVDYIALAALLRGLYVGYKSGIFQELLRVAAYIVAVALTAVLHGSVAQHLTLHTFLNEGSAKAVAFASVFVAMYMLLKIIRTVIVKALKVSEGGAGQKIMGALVGGARLLVLLSFFFMLVDMTPLNELKTDLHERSLTGPRIASVAPQIFEFVSRFSPEISFRKADG